MVGVDRRTVARWRGWWQTRFTSTPFWRAQSAGFMPPVDTSGLPAALLERFAGDFGIRNTDPESFFHADSEFECVNRIKPEAIRPKQWQIVADLIDGGLEHQIFHQHFFDALAKIDI